MSEISEASDAISSLDDALKQKVEPVEVAPAKIAKIKVDNTRPQVDDSEWREPWDRRDDETDYQWDVFCHFRDLGLGRTRIKVVDYIIDVLERWPKDSDRVELRRNISNYIQKFEWTRRVFAFDQEQERLYQLARSEAIRDMAQRHEDVIEKAIDGLMAPIDALSLAMVDDPDFISSLAKSDKKKLIDLANRATRTIPSLMAAERLSRGMPTTIVGGNVEHEVIHTVERDQIGGILEVLERAGVLDVGQRSLGVGEVVDAEVVEVHPVPAEGDDD